MDCEREGKRKVCEELPRDRISGLPDSLICQILLCLPTTYAVRTSTLSTRWRNLWRSVPGLDLDSEEFPDYDDFVSFGDSFLDSQRESRIHKLKLEVAVVGTDTSSVTSWIHAVVRRKIQHLDVECQMDIGEYVDMPLSLYTCETLVSLRVHAVTMDNMQFVALPCLKKMQLEYVVFADEVALERLISCCPILEELNITKGGNHEVKDVRVRSQTLKSLVISDNVEFEDWVVVIDTPALKYLRLHGGETASYIVNNLDSSAKVDVSLYGLWVSDVIFMPSKNSTRDLLTGISRARDIILHRTTTQVIYDYSKLEALPEFRYLSHLHAEFSIPEVEMLPTFLESCPNLKSLVLVLIRCIPITFPSVPRCLVSSLEQVELRTPISGYAAEMELIRYFLQYAVILKSLTLHLNYCGKPIVQQLLKFRRCSKACEVIVL